MSVFDYSIFVDCGAPSLYNKLSRKVEKKGVMGSTIDERKYDDFSYVETDAYTTYRDAYIEFLHENKDKITVYSNLDVINNPKLTYENQRILESNGLNPIPVYHLNTNEKYLKKYLNKYDYIAIGGLIPNPTNVIKGYLDDLFKRIILDENGFPRVKLHGFACTAITLMERYPWYSVDSATARKLSMYGGIAIPEWTGNDLKTYTISSRDVPLVDRFSEQVLNSLERHVQELNYTLEELADSHIKRMIWNYYIYRKVINERVPMWPWRTVRQGDSFVKESAENATKKFTMYLAGATSKKDEIIIWETLKPLDNLELPNGRLQSYFYKGNLIEIIKNKYHEGR